jgi:glutathione-regulated potassium-efflux system protein KefB
VFVVAIDDVDKATTLVRLLRKHYPDARVLARARDRRHAWQLLDLGVKPFRELFGSSLEMGREVLVALGMEARQATEYASRFREFDERVLDAQRLMQDDEDALLQSARNARRELEELFEADAGEGTLGRIVERKD